MNMLHRYSRLLACAVAAASLTGCYAALPVGAVAGLAVSGRKASDPTVDSIRIGDRVRYANASASNTRMVGRVSDLRGDTLFISTEGPPSNPVVVVAGDAVMRPEVRGERKSVIAAVAGPFVASTLASVAGYYVEKASTNCTGTDCGWAGILLGGLVGMIGGIIWGVQDHEVWVPVRPR